jgi:hypothetical protein
LKTNCEKCYSRKEYLLILLNKNTIIGTGRKFIMYKKVLASVAAIAIAFGAVGLPVAESGISFGGQEISASAETETETLTYGKFNYEVLSNGTVSISRYTGTDTSITIPSEIDGKAVTEIGSNAFSSWNRLESITIPDTVTTIGDCAFLYCESLKSITIPDSVTSIGGMAFGICHSLESIVLPNGLKTLSTSVFYNCAALSSLTIPDSVTKIEDCAFLDAQVLKV